MIYSVNESKMYDIRVGTSLPGSGDWFVIYGE